MIENWVVYGREIDEAPSITGVDLQFADSAPDEERPTALRVAVSFLEMDESGLPRGDEFEAMEGVEEMLVEALEPTGAVLVARRSHEGERAFYFYGPRGDAARAAAEGALAGLAGRESSVQAATDPDWSVYFDDLLPDAMELRHFFDEMVVAQFEQAGDPLVVPRPVTHFIYFTDAADRDRFAAAAEANGFKTEAFEDEEGEDGETVGLRLERDDAINLEHITEVTGGLMMVAEEAGGRYDGWEAMVIQPGGEHPPFPAPPSAQ